MALSAVLPRLTERATRGRIRDYEAYHRELARRLRPGMTVVDVGCGDGGVAPFAWGRTPDVRRIGLDPDPAAAANPYMDAFGQLEPDKPWPVKDREADLIAARYVLEHVGDPEAFLAEVWRTLEPGGELVFLTPNARHPTIMASRLLPHRVRQAVLRRTRGVEEEDVFPAYYRMNTPGRLFRQLSWAGFTDIRLEAREFTPSEYMAFTTPTYLAACGYDTVIRGLGLEPWMGAHILGTARRPAFEPVEIFSPRSAVR